MGDNSFLSRAELRKIGFKSFGKNVLISNKASIYGASNISIGDNVRIDDYCILSGVIELKSYIHISAFCALYGKQAIYIDSFSGTSPRTTIFSAIDDFSGEFLINPMIPMQLTKVKGGPVIINKYVQIGANTIIMPNLTIGEGTVTGAFSFVNKNLDNWGIYAGIPAIKIKERKKDLLILAKILAND
jgi:galactoside O-acetyltransferase